MGLSFRHLTSTKQLSRADIDLILKTARDMEKVLAKEINRDGGKNPHLQAGAREKRRDGTEPIRLRV